ncbi:MAG: hypothetical protein M3Z11_12040 [Candidatus Dormibacteraeota bacterium]|nr:hypothetical protein [Candidatus Dormibacteraeota bacterium]
MPRVARPRVTLPRVTLPRVTLPRVRLPRVTRPQFRVPRIPRVAWAVAAVLAVLILAPLAYVLSPSGRHLVAGRSSPPPTLTKTGPPASPSSSALAAAIPGVEAKTGLKYVSGSCPASGPCLKLASQASGLNAAVVQFSTANTGGRQCAGYVFRDASGWHFLNATCAVPGQVSPLPGSPASVHVPGQCANVRDAASLAGNVIVCLDDGTAVRVDAGPNYADGKLWWHLEKQGWMAHDFLIGG